MIFRFSIFSRAGIRALVAVAVLAIAGVDAAAREQSKQWIVFKNCRLIANRANDGDSFHVNAGEKEYLFRLYFVDAPETDEMTPKRLVDQAKYFGITVPETIEAGREAKEFTRQKLSEPFTVFTHMSDAMGQSRMKRFYAFVQTKEGDLGELLVRNGLARNYGFKTTPPGLSSSRIELEKLQQFENRARQEKIGAWGVNVGRLNVHAQAPSSLNSFVPEQKNHLRWVRADFRGAAVPHRKEKTPLGEIDINTATEKLTAVPGIGRVVAGRIIAAQPFRSPDDLKKISRIGDKDYVPIPPYFSAFFDYEQESHTMRAREDSNH